MQHNTWLCPLYSNSAQTMFQCSSAWQRADPAKMPATAFVSQLLPASGHMTHYMWHIASVQYNKNLHSSLTFVGRRHFQSSPKLQTALRPFCWVLLAAAALAAPAAADTAGAHDQACSHLPPLGVSHWHQLLPSQAHPLLSGCAGVCTLAGLRLLPCGCAGRLCGELQHLICRYGHTSECCLPKTCIAMLRIQCTCLLSEALIVVRLQLFLMHIPGSEFRRSFVKGIRRISRVCIGDWPGLLLYLKHTLHMRHVIAAHESFGVGHCNG